MRMSVSGTVFLKQREYKRERDILVKELIGNSRLSLRKIADILKINRESVRRISMSKELSP
jgi:DNA-binding CsgD family transcriptional regulator